MLERVIIVHSRLIPPPAPGPDGVLPEPGFEHIEEVFIDRVEQQVYSFYGVRPDLTGLSSPAQIHARLMEVVPHSQASQRERLFDDCDLVISELVDEHCGNRGQDTWDVETLKNAVNARFGFAPQSIERATNADQIAERIFGEVEKFISEREAQVGKDVLITAFRHFYLREIDKQWLDHLAAMEHLRSGINLRGYGNRDPKQEYKREGFEVFTEMMRNLKANVLEKTFHVRIVNNEDAQRISMPRRTQRTVEGRGGEDGAPRERQKPETVKREAPKVGRNDDCPCGSGKKYKKCCGK
jgi:preprotein translocase subunit SecA